MTLIPKEYLLKKKPFLLFVLTMVVLGLSLATPSVARELPGYSCYDLCDCTSEPVLPIGCFNPDCPHQPYTTCDLFCQDVPMPSLSGSENSFFSSAADWEKRVDVGPVAAVPEDVSKDQEPQDVGLETVAVDGLPSGVMDR